MRQDTIDSLLDRIEKLNNLGIRLSVEKDHDSLLEAILTGARAITGADAGTLYLLTESRELRFEIVQTASLGLAMGGSSGVPVTLPPIALYGLDGCPNLRTVVARAAVENRIINIPDIDEEVDFDFSGTRAFDARTGYRSRSFLTVPMNDHQGRLIGILQLLNALDPETANVIPFSQEDERLIASLASQAAVALNRKSLIDELKSLLESLARLIANAIDKKSPYTGGHCRRVPILTMLLADAVARCQTAPFRGLGFDEKERYELEMAAWLHDCGKIATPEHIIDKRTKLETIVDRIHLIESRFELLRQEARIEFLEQKVAALEAGRREDIPPLEAALEARLAAYESDLDFLRRCNRGEECMAEEDLARLGRLAEMQVRGEDGEARPLLTAEEVRCLSIVRGTLTAEEREIIEDHVVATIHLLETMPFPDHLKNVPKIAGSHHEKVNGTGYPLGLTAGQMPLQARILAMADVFEALTAADRPYRRANTLAEALEVMAGMCRSGHLDPDLFDLFVGEKIYLPYAEAFLRPEQLDSLPVSPAAGTGLRPQE